MMHESYGKRGRWLAEKPMVNMVSAWCSGTLIVCRFFSHDCYRRMRRPNPFHRALFSSSASVSLFLVFNEEKNTDQRCSLMSCHEGDRRDLNVLRSGLPLLCLLFLVFFSNDRLFDSASNYFQWLFTNEWSLESEIDTTTNCNDDDNAHNSPNRFCQ